MIRGGEWLLDRPWRVLAATAIVVVVALAHLIDPRTLEPRIDVDPAMTALLPGAGPALDTFARARRYFDDDDVLLIAWHDEQLFSPDVLAALKRLTRRVERLPGVIAVDSLASALELQVKPDETVVGPFLRELPADAAAGARMRDRATANPLFRGRLVAADGRHALLAVHFDPALDTRTLLDRVETIRQASAAEAGTTTQFLSGPLLVRLEISRILLRDLLRVMPLAVAATLLVAVAGFRSLRGVVLPMVGNLAAVLVTLALFTAAGESFNFVTVILPPVVYVIGFAYAIHMVSEFDRQFCHSGHRREAVAATIRAVFLPLGLTALTTAVAFAALALSDIDSIRLFGLYAALGVLLAWFSALTVVPAGLLLLPGLPRAAAGRSRLENLALVLTRFVVGHRRSILTCATLIGAGALALAPRIVVDTAVLGNFGNDSPLQENFRRIGEVFSGPVPMRIVIDAERPDAFKDPAQLRELDRLAVWLRSQPEIGGVYTLADYIALLHRAIDPLAAERQPLPASAREVAHLVLAGGGEDLRLFVDPAFRTTLLHLGTSALSTAAVNRLAARIDERLAALPDDLHGQVTGTTYLIARSVDDLARGQIASLALALVAIFIVLAVVFGSPRTALLALLPNALPVLFYFGLLGGIPVTLNLTTSLVACAVFGIAIDDTVHFLARYAIEVRRTGAGEAALAATLAAVLRPVTLTTLALGAGFLALTAGELQSQAEFGALAAATLLFAWVIDLTFTPALFYAIGTAPAWFRRPPDNARHRG